MTTHEGSVHSQFRIGNHESKICRISGSILDNRDNLSRNGLIGPLWSYLFLRK